MRTCDGERSTNRQHQTQNSAVELPQPLLHGVSIRPPPPTSHRPLDTRMREQSIDHKRVEGDDSNRTCNSNHDQPRYGHSFFYRIGVLQGVISQREVLVIRLDGIEGIEACNEGADSWISDVRMWKQVACDVGSPYTMIK